MTDRTRRNLTRLLVAAAAYLPAPLLLATPVRVTSGDPDLPAFGPYLDTLLPGDATCPSATQLGVDKDIQERFSRNPQLQQLVVLGCGWLDREARRSGEPDFASLPPAQKESIVSAAESSSPQSMPRVFFNVILDLAMLHYYIQSEAWAGLDYAGPPQPGGFIGHDRPLAEAAK